MITVLLKKAYLAAEKRKQSKENVDYIINVSSVENFASKKFEMGFPEQIAMSPIFPNTNDEDLDQYYNLQVAEPYDKIFLDYLNQRDEVEAAYIKPSEGVPG